MPVIVPVTTNSNYKIIINEFRVDWLPFLPEKIRGECLGDS